MNTNDRIISLFDRAVSLYDLGQHTAALSLYDEIIAIGIKNAVIFYNRGLALQGLKQFEAAVASYEQAIALHPAYAEAHCNRGDSLQALSRLTEALASYDRAISIKPDIAYIYSSRGAAFYKLGELAASVENYDRAISLASADTEAYFNRGLALMELGRGDEALADFRRVDESHPTYADAKINIFAIRLSEPENVALIEEAGAEAARTIVKRACDKLSVQKSLADFHVRHDLEQTSYLIEQGYDGMELRDARERFRNIYERDQASSHRATNANVQVTDDEIADINAFRQTMVRYRSTLHVRSCLNPDNDWTEIEEQYFGSDPEIVCIDNLLSPIALAELQKFCLVSAVWHKDYDGQYLGAFAQEGFIGPRHCQIACELRAKMPRIFGGHRLRQLWSFKCMSQTHTGLKVHADFASVNLNFWLTPDEANLDPASGGLIVHDVSAPTDWNFQDYNNNEKRIYEFLHANGASRIKIPYRCNRAVLFNSSLFHETDKFQFKEGYENRRTNVTYLFGKSLRTV